MTFQYFAFDGYIASVMALKIIHSLQHNIRQMIVLYVVFHCLLKRIFFFKKTFLNIFLNSFINKLLKLIAELFLWENLLTR